MTDAGLVDLWRAALITVATVAAPFLLAALAVGLVTSIVQAATQLQESVLSFVPKLVAVGVVIVVAGPWVVERLANYTRAAVTQASTMSGDRR